MIDILNGLYADNTDGNDTAIKRRQCRIGFVADYQAEILSNVDLDKKLGKFLKISGMKRVLFSSLAKNYKN